MKFRDPYDDMGDEEFEAHMLELFNKPESVSVSIRMPKHLLGRIRAVAAEANQPYQTLMKGILEDAIARLERRRSAPQTRPASGRLPSSRRARSASRRVG